MKNKNYFVKDLFFIRHVSFLLLLLLFFFERKNEWKKIASPLFFVGKNDFIFKLDLLFF